MASLKQKDESFFFEIFLLFSEFRTFEYVHCSAYCRNEGTGDTGDSKRNQSVSDRSHWIMRADCI